MDIIFIRSLKIDTYIGVWDWEQQQKQSVEIDLEVGWDIQRAARTDDLAATVDYEAIANKLTQLIGSKSYRLVETMAEEIAQTLHQEFGIRWLRIRVSKPSAVPNAKSVGVFIERQY